MTPETEKTLEQVQEEKIAAENPTPPEYSPEQIQKAKDTVESWREEAMQPVAVEHIKDFINLAILNKEHIISYLK